MAKHKTRRVTTRFKWDRLKVSFWFTPAIMSLGAILLAMAMYWVDGYIPNEMLDSSHIVLTGSVDELRGYLINMSTTVLATAGIVFTLLTLPLSTVAAQYGSRLLRVFLGDRTTQLVLGMFVATFVYCISAATSIPPVEVEPEAPQVTATVGLILVLATFATLILLVQHISTMLQAPNIAAAAGAELRDVVLAEIPDNFRSGEDHKFGLNTLPDSLVEAEGYEVRVRENGYIQYIDPETLFGLARDKNLVIRLLHKPGHFVHRNMAVALVWSASPSQDKAGLRHFDEELYGAVRQAFEIGRVRTPTQDIAYAVNQLVEMAVRAMSAAINDPFTAMTCLDYIGEGLRLVIQQGVRNPYYYDQEGKLCLIFEPVTFEELLSSAFDMLRHCSCDNASVLQHMLEVIDAIGEEVNSPTVKNSVKVRQELLRHASLIQAESQAGKLIEQDRQMIRRNSETLLMKLKETP